MKTIYLFALLFLLWSCEKNDLPEPGNNAPPDLEENEDETLISDVVVIHDTFEGSEIVIAGNKKDQYIVSFERELDGNLLEFTPVHNKLPVILKDKNGDSEFDVFGNAVSGTLQGKKLKPTQSLMAYWFSIGTFYPGTEIFPDVEYKGEFEGKSIGASNGWLVPFDEVRSGGVGKDGIPAISSPRFTDASNVDFLDFEDLVVGFSGGGIQKAYPHTVLDWHEIINDGMAETAYSIIYCPLTGTATCWNRDLDGKVTTFGVSGLLYNTNIIPYDRETDSNWSQLFDGAIHGDLKGTRPENFMVLETKWETWKKMYPNSEVVNYNTGFSRNYGYYPYGDYKTENYLIFPVKYEDNRLPLKERVHTVIVKGKARVYRFDSFKG